LPKKEQKLKVDFHKSYEDSKWYWTVIDGKGNLFAYGAKGYSRREDAVRSFQKLDQLF